MLSYNGACLEGSMEYTYFGYLLRKTLHELLLKHSALGQQVGFKIALTFIENFKFSSLRMVFGILFDKNGKKRKIARGDAWNSCSVTDRFG